jgi:hypothetical protein
LKSRRTRMPPLRRLRKALLLKLKIHPKNQMAK